MKDLIVDCFAGGGGASVGIEMALGRPVDIAINHDPDAILMHKTNHPDTLHLTEDIFKVNLKKYVKGQHVALMWASPDCTSHSKAKGGKPREKGPSHNMVIDVIGVFALLGAVIFVALFTCAAEEEAYEKAIYQYIDKTTMEILRLRVKNKSLEQCLKERKEDESDECK